MVRRSGSFTICERRCRARRPRSRSARTTPPSPACRPPRSLSGCGAGTRAGRWNRTPARRRRGPAPHPRHRRRRRPPCRPSGCSPESPNAAAAPVVAAAATNVRARQRRQCLISGLSSSRAPLLVLTRQTAAELGSPVPPRTPYSPQAGASVQYPAEELSVKKVLPDIKKVLSSATFRRARPRLSDNYEGSTVARTGRRARGPAVDARLRGNRHVVQTRDPFQVRGVHRRVHRGAHGGRRAVERPAATAAGRERGAREGRGAGRRDARDVGLHRHQPEHHQPHRRRRVPHEGARVRGHRQVGEHAVHHEHRLQDPLHEPHPAPGGERARRVRAAGVRRLRRRYGARGVLRRGATTPTGDACSATPSRCT